MRTSWPVLVVASVFFLSLSAAQTLAAQEKKWTWKDRNGRIRTGIELQEIINLHEQWLDSEGETGKPADLVGADLSGANLGAVNLSRGFLAGVVLSQAKLGNANLSGARVGNADLSGAFLLSVNLEGADLTRVNLSGADLTQANLNDADLTHANLSHAQLLSAKLRHAELHGADLTDADLDSADLSGATLRAWEAPGEAYHEVLLVRASLRNTLLRGAILAGVNLKEARLDGADLYASVFEPTQNPETLGLAAAENLEFLTYGENPYGLIQLRKEFADAGFRDQERKITYALKRREAELLSEGCRGGADWGNCAAYWLNTALFDWTCQYGLSPHRPLLIFVGLWLAASFLYLLAMHLPGVSGLYLVEAAQESKRTELEGIALRPGRATASQKWKAGLDWLREEYRLLRAALYFSFTRAVSFGFRRRALGRWLLPAPTTRDYYIKSVGWPRSVGALQSLISIYLVLLWALAYFGRPFQ